jgi:hypothetical protein
MVLATEPLIVDRFDEGLLAWEVKKFSGETIYAVQIDGNGNSVLSARSKASASGLLKHIEFDPEKYPVLTWRWKIARTLSKGDARSKQGDDYAARIYVIFPHWIKPLSRTINYIWANRLPVEEAVSSPYLSRDMMLAVESGDNKAGQWVSEERNLVADFRRLFGVNPPMGGGIAIMTDTDGTKEEAQAWYDDLILHPAK